VESEDTPLRGVSAVKIRRCAACGKRCHAARCAVVSRPTYGFRSGMLAGVEGHTGTARVLRMTCMTWVVKPVAAVTSRIWRVGGELRMRRGRGDAGMQLGPRRSARKSPAQIVPNHQTIEPTGEIPPPSMKLRHLMQFPWSGRRPAARGSNRVQTGYLRGAAGTSAVGGRPVGGGGGRPAGRPAGGGHHAKR